LAVTLAESAIAGGLGFAVAAPDDLPPTVALFSESASRAVVVPRSGREAELESLASVHRVPIARLGITGGSWLDFPGLFRVALSDRKNILVFRELGLVSQVFDERTLSTLQGDLCIGHTRYSTTGSTTWENAQPTFKTKGGRGLALGHNGNLVNTAELAERVG